MQPSIADTIPLATYLAGGGFAGLGVWAADKVLFGGKVFGGLLDNVVEITFMISGPWSEPIIEKLDGVKSFMINQLLSEHKINENEVLIYLAHYLRLAQNIRIYIFSIRLQSHGSLMKE